jgi:AcrR family transcriptional regulator
MSGSHNSDVRRRPGGRSARVRESVLDATMTALRDGGWDGVNIAEVATRAGVHETSIYRRWRTREGLMIDALLTASDEQLPIPDTGTLRGDLIAFATELGTLLADPLGCALAHAMAAPTVDPAIVETSAKYFQARLEMASAIIERASDRGEIPVCADPSLVLEMLIAPLHLRTLLTRQPLDDELPNRLADVLIHGLATPPQALAPLPGQKVKARKASRDLHRGQVGADGL